MEVSEEGRRGLSSDIATREVGTDEAMHGVTESARLVRVPPVKWNGSEAAPGHPSFQHPATAPMHLPPRSTKMPAKEKPAPCPVPRALCLVPRAGWLAGWV
jgi:hypothetical protein